MLYVGTNSLCDRCKIVKDESVFSMLRSERDRCLRVIERVSAELEKLPRGSLSRRKVKSGGKEYDYPCLRYRDGAQVKLEHVSPQQVDTLKLLLEKRNKLREDLKSNKRRIKTIDLILHRAGC